MSRNKSPASGLDGMVSFGQISRQIQQKAWLPTQQNYLRSRDGSFPPRLQRDVVWGGAVVEQIRSAQPDLDDLTERHPITGEWVRPREQLRHEVRDRHQKPSLIPFDALISSWKCGPPSKKAR